MSCHKGEGMVTAEERYLFDLNGYLVLRKVLPPPVLAAMNESIDRLETLSDQEVEALNLTRKYQQDNVYAQVGPAPQLGLADYSGNILPCGGPFEELIDWPATLPYLEETIGVPMRLDAASFMSRHSGGGFVFHHGYAEMLPYSEYVFEQDAFRCASIKISFALTDVGVEDGCFAVIPGSHKSHFRNPAGGAGSRSCPSAGAASALRGGRRRALFRGSVPRSRGESGLQSASNPVLLLRPRLSVRLGPVDRGGPRL